MTNCIFCKIAGKEIPSEILYEDDRFMAFVDIAPVNKGHALVITKEHFKTFVDMPDELLQGMMPVVKRVADAVVKATGADGYNISCNNNGAAGQVVMHFHMHVVPRFGDDGLRHWPSKQYAEGEASEVAGKIKTFLNS